MGGCLNRIPFASMIAAVMCFIGVVLFSVMMGWGFNASVEQTRRTLRIEDWPWLDKVQISFIVLTVIMSIFTIFFLAIGATATGATREQMYRDHKSKCGGQCACAVAMFFTSALLICWLFIITILSAICSAYFLFDSMCGTMSGFSDADCIDLGVFEPVIRPISNANMMLCGGDAQQFCALSVTAKSWYIVGWVGTCIVILGLSMFLAVHSTNYAHVGTASRYVELREILAEPIPAPPSIPPPTRGEMSEYVNDTHPRRRDPWNQNNNGKAVPTSASSSRFAEQMSDSVSQYQYDRKYYNNR